MVGSPLVFPSRSTWRGAWVPWRCIRFRDTITALDQGTLFITNKRLLFHGHKKTTTTALKKVIAFTVFADGLKIEKDTGKPQYYIGTGDLELTGSVLDAVLKETAGTRGVQPGDPH